jgi:hypothetical protein
MKKSSLSVFGLTCGIIATVMSGILFPLALITNSSAGIIFLGFVAMFITFIGMVGIITSTIKLLITGNEIVVDQENRIIAKRGLWFSLVPTIFWIFTFIMIIGSIK